MKRLFSLQRRFILVLATCFCEGFYVDNTMLRSAPRILLRIGRIAAQQKRTALLSSLPQQLDAEVAPQFPSSHTVDDSLTRTFQPKSGASKNGLRPSDPNLPFQPKRQQSTSGNALSPQPSSSAVEELDAAWAEADTVSYEEEQVSTISVAKKGYLAPENHLKASTEPLKTASDYDTLESYFEAENIKSRPQGKWDPFHPLRWTESFGSRSAYYAKMLHDQVGIKLRPGDEGYHDVSDITAPGITIVRSKEQAQKVMQRLLSADPRIYHACDTEVMDIDLKSVGPVGNGYVTCVSIYSGPDFDYGLGDGPGTALFIDNLDEACGVLQEFKVWFEDERFLKVWHNYGFDRHVMWNEGVNVKGFGGDTMHMARLQNTSRGRMSGSTGYSLESLTEDLVGRKKESMKTLFGIPRLRKDGSEGSMVDVPPVQEMQRTPKHRLTWLRYSGYDAKGTWLLRNRLEEELRKMKWLKNSNLFDYYWMHMRPFGEVLTNMERLGIRVDDRSYLAGIEKQAKEDRERHRSAFAKWAAKMIGPDGLAMNTASSVQLQTFLFGGAANSKTKEKTEGVRTFSLPRKEVNEEALEALRLRNEAKNEEPKSKEDDPKKLVFNVDGRKIELEQMKAAEIRMMLKEKGLKTAGKKQDLKDRLSEHVIQEAKRDLGIEEPQDEFESMTVADLKDALKSRGLSIKGNKPELLQRMKDDVATTVALIEAKQKVHPTYEEMLNAVTAVLENIAQSSGTLKDFVEEQKKKDLTPSRTVDVTITSLGLTPNKYTASGAPSVTSDVLQSLAGDPFADPPKYGLAYEKLGKEGCEALFNLCAIGSIDTMIANFITSLQELADHESRVHCSLNLNTETGRLSSRRPNLQNQPALEKDKYKIRQAFQSSPGNNLIVADYGQLELRLLASITSCKSMIDAFKAGGDFHSRTAMDMFPYVKEKLDSGECLLEWDYSKGDPPKPLLKDQFASERRKAKTLNFSIAYGKTAHGLSKDWGVSREEAEAMLQAWYEARPEVRDWQKATKLFAQTTGITRTLMGRYRHLPHGTNPKAMKLFGHAQRASINTPIQGGAADIAMMAMNKINENHRLKQLGWVLLLQIHDEVILEGPEETAEEAFHEVKTCMEQPWVFGLSKTAVPLTVDGSFIHKNWYDAK